MSVVKLLEQAKALSIARLALTDINNTSGCLELLREAPKYGISPVVGIDFRNGNEQKYIGLAKNNHGFAQMNRHLSEHSHTSLEFPHHAPELEEVFFIYPFSDSIFELKENEFLGINSKDLNRLRFSNWINHPDKLVVLQSVTFQTKKDFNAHRLLRAVDKNILLSQLPASEQGFEEDKMFSLAELTQLFKEYPFILENTQRLLDECSISIEFKVSKNKKFFEGSIEKDLELLRRHTFAGAHERYGTGYASIILDRINKELEIIAQKGFTAYFLISWDIIQFARSKGFFYVGRGSGANSIVAYCLYITDVDPIDLDLYFERFINLYRENPPDFDLDFSWKDRDAVTDYIFQKWGTERTCLLATYSTFQVNSVMRELGKVFGLPKTEIEELIGNYGKKPAPTELGRLVYVYSEYLRDFPSHLSIHAGGILISEQSIYHYTATNLPPKGYPTSQFDMIIAEDVGLYKFDILSQRGLGHIKETIEIVKEQHGEDVDIHRIDDFKKDERIKQLLRIGNTAGCFYVESPAMRMLLSKLEADNYLGLVAASSIIRPGVARSGMMREYILRHRHQSARDKAHPTMVKIMPETYGVMVYQEDVIKVAHEFAGLSFAEADVLRRGMSGKFRSREEFQKVRDQFFSNCKARKYDDKLTAEIWYQIESFAGYSFSKGHSASYAVESYQSLFLKAYYPLEFMVGVINNFGGFYKTEFYVHEARMCGAEIEAPHVNESNFMTSIQAKTIYLGFVHLAGLEEKVGQAIEAERKCNGPFTSLEEFLSRLPLSLEQLIILVRIGAFRFTGKTNQKLLWEAHFLVNKHKKQIAKSNLFQVGTSTKQWQVPDLHTDSRDMVIDQMELLGFPLSSPFEILKRQDLNGIPALEIPNFAGKQIQMLGYLVTLKPTRTVKGERMYFGTFVDKAGHWIDTVHFPQAGDKYPFRGSGCYLIRGKVTEEFGFFTVEVHYLERLEYWNRGDG